MEEEVIIRCAGLNDIVREVQKAVSEAASGTQTAVFSKGEQEYYFPLSKVLFFETDGNTINVHTADDIYETRYRLYELEEMLPDVNESPEELMIRQYEYEEVHQMLSSLHESYRDVLTMKFLYRMSDEEIASVMGIKPASVRVVCHRALKSLKKSYQTREEGENS